MIREKINLKKRPTSTGLVSIAIGKCLGCCFACYSDNCRSYRNYEQCEHNCKNYDCAENSSGDNYYCDRSHCRECRVIRCTRNNKFNPTEIFTKYC